MDGRGGEVALSNVIQFGQSTGYNSETETTTETVGTSGQVRRSSLRSPCTPTSIETCKPRGQCPKGNTIHIDKEWGIARPHNQNIREDMPPTSRQTESPKRQSRSRSRWSHRHRPDRSHLKEGAP
ncbi:hypothetical protein NDU88_003565 [Pleurodeles waltl]|uniref:Uncharacterized protein n=1 Tax=Pleurodeles waltl TaxID=8319 RepID=A0AAV7NH11_PLEWA|nr:hypothetical protein NDU88_003565 [Pleurodeles waltl]